MAFDETSAQLVRENRELKVQVETLAGLLKRCARCLPPDHGTRKVATDYMRQHGLMSPLRTPAAGVQGRLSSPAMDPQRLRELAAIEAKAREIYNGWRHHLTGWVPWVEGGNSIRQDEARRAARNAGVTEVDCG